MSTHALDVPYAQESWTPAESDILRRYFTNLEGPVFALVNLPEVVKGALFARYSAVGQKPQAVVPGRICRRPRRERGPQRGRDGRVGPSRAAL